MSTHNAHNPLACHTKWYFPLKYLMQSNIFPLFHTDDCYSFRFFECERTHREHSLKRAVHQELELYDSGHAFLPFYRCCQGILAPTYWSPDKCHKKGKWIILQLTLGRHMIRLMAEHIQIVYVSSFVCERQWYWHFRLMNTIFNAAFFLSHPFLPFVHSGERE